VATCLPAGALLGRLLHALREQRLELRVTFWASPPEFVQELALLVVDLAPGLKLPAQDFELVAIDLAGGQDGVFDLP
jgi:hypothetical protein